MGSALLLAILPGIFGYFLIDATASLTRSQAPLGNALFSKLCFVFLTAVKSDEAEPRNESMERPLFCLLAYSEKFPFLGKLTGFESN